jgi:hypothetical protein
MSFRQLIQSTDADILIASLDLSILLLRHRVAGRHTTICFLCCVHRFSRAAVKFNARRLDAGQRSLNISPL